MTKKIIQTPKKKSPSLPSTTFGIEELPSPLSLSLQGELLFENRPIKDYAKKWKTPFYLYGKKTLSTMAKNFLLAPKKFGIKKSMVCYAVKANSHPEVLKILSQHKIGADVVSIGELKKALHANIPAQKIVFSGVGKTNEEILFAMKCGKNGIWAFNVESREELMAINTLAKKHGLSPRIALRLNPEVEVKTHKYISTGNKSHKFGLLKNDILKLFLEHNAQEHYWSHCKFIGLSIHIGSQLTELQGTELAIKEMCQLLLNSILPLKNTSTLWKKIIQLQSIDVGGGLGIDYGPEDQKSIAPLSLYMEKVSKVLHNEFFKPYKDQYPKDKIPLIIFEPGRILVGKMGVLVSKVIRTKQSEHCHFTIVDCGMNDLIRPALYEASHPIYPGHWPLSENEKDNVWHETHVVGPICESSDCFGENLILPKFKEGELLVISNGGAYGKTMASTYNERPLIKEYMNT